MPRSFAGIRRATRLIAPTAAAAALTAGLLAPSASAAWAADAGSDDGWAGRNLARTGDAVPAEGLAAASRQTAAATTRPRGIDVSRYQSGSTLTTCNGSVQVKWASVRASGRSFAFIKATGRRASGVSEDPCFDRNWAGARAAGLYRGAYHYAIPTTWAGSAAADARHFVGVTGTMQQPGDLPPVLDLEATGGLSRAQVQAWASTWLTTVRSLTGRQPILYTGPSFWRTYVGGGSSFAGFPLWIAHYTTRSSPTVPSPWNAWTFWQSSAAGRVPGVSGYVDVNTFDGTAAQLRALAHPAAVPTAAASAAAVYRGQPWSVTGTLRSTTGALVRAAAVTLYRRAAGSTAWTAVSTTRTNATTAAYRFDLRPTAAASYQVRYAGGRDFAASVSAVLSHTYSEQLPTALTATVSSTRVVRRQPVQLAGALTLGPTRVAVPHAAVAVYRKVGTGAWTQVRRLTTVTGGRYGTTLRPLRTAVYKVVYVGTPAQKAATAPLRTVAVR
jgi:GH25 family lysozyme M1 (1,4-beta-N-acetylmuramidase)